jgi:phosphomannomutase
LNVLNAHAGTLSNMTVDFPKLESMPEIRLEVDEDNKFAIVDKLVAAAKADAEAQEGVSIHDIDGIRVEYDFGWWLMRASNTQNALSIRMEADTKPNLKKLFDTVQGLLRTQGLDLTNPMD